MDGRTESASPHEFVLSALYNKTVERLREIDNEIQNQLPDKGPSLEYAPPGSFKSRQSGYKDERIHQLKLQKEALVSDYNHIAEEILEISPKEVRDRCTPFGDQLELHLDKSNSSKDIVDDKNIYEAQISMNKIIANYHIEKEEHYSTSSLSSVLRLHEFEENSRDIIEPNPRVDFEKDDYEP